MSRVVVPSGGLLTPHAVYRYHDRDGRLLYVGMTYDPDNRDHWHQGRSPWRPAAVASTVTWFPTRGLALLAEWVAIVTERPVHNGTDRCPPVRYPGRTRELRPEPHPLSHT